MISKVVQDALNEQINAELFSAYLYLSMSAHFSEINLNGFAHWMQIQAREEQGHAMKIYEYLHDRGGQVKLKAIAEPAHHWESPLAAFEAALAHEVSITNRINKLTDLAIKENDHATQIFLQWFVTEQVEEEDHANANVEKLKWVGDNKGGLYILDHELAGRS